jgi:hypothetical protein
LSLPADTLQALRRRGDGFLGHAFHPLDIVIPARDLQGLGAGGLPLDYQLRRGGGIAAETGDGDAVCQHVQGFPVQGDLAARGHIAPYQPTLNQGALQFEAFSKGSWRHRQEPTAHEGNQYSHRACHKKSLASIFTSEAPGESSGILRGSDTR